MKHVVTPLFLLLLLCSGLGVLYIRSQRVGLVQAVGDLTILWGFPSGDPLFQESNILPGDVFSRSIQVTNNASVTRTIALRGVQTEGDSSDAAAYSIVISADSTDLYGGSHPSGSKTLEDFFAASAIATGIPLSPLSSASSATYTVLISLDSSLGNEVSAREVGFDLTVGTTVVLPPSCTMPINGKIVEGTQGNDRLQGTSKNDLIIAWEGNDRVNGAGGDDCILGGVGNNVLDGGTGDDVLVSDDGRDTLNGGGGNDRLSAGLGNDSLEGGSGDDVLDGEAGVDRLNGGSGEDSLDGGLGSDHLDGGSGIDSCVGGETLLHCE